jgi:hypothetical protein
MAFDFAKYFRDIAINLKDIAHTSAVPKFHRVSGLAGLEELLQNLVLTDDKGYQLVIENNRDSAFYYNAETLLDNQYYVFYILKRAYTNDFDAIEDIKDGAKSVSKKIYAKMFDDSFNDSVHKSNTGLRALEKGSVRYDTVGPLADGYWGAMCSFTVPENPGIKYKASDWLNEDIPDTYIGVVDTAFPDEADIIALPTIKSNNTYITRDFTAVNQWVIVVEPAEFDPFKKVIDASEVDKTKSFRTAPITVNGSPYRLMMYAPELATTESNKTFTFKK